MSKIVVGDLVEVIRVHCNKSRAMGWQAVVLSISGWDIHSCGLCLQSQQSDKWASVIGPQGGTRFVPVSWLKRIDPPSNDESITEQEELKCYT